jgi:hypothetical protein
MSVTTPTTTTNGSKTALNKDGSPRKKAQYIPRTPEEIAFSSCNNILKRLPEDKRGRVMRSLTALHSAS